MSADKVAAISAEHVRHDNAEQFGDCLQHQLSVGCLSASAEHRRNVRTAHHLVYISLMRKLYAVFGPVT